MFKWIYKAKQAIQDKISEKGQGMVEYALVLAAVALIAAFVLSDSDDGLRGAVGGAFSNAKIQIDSASSAVNS
ncbi:MAG: hypothetical protein IJU71_02575 [Selenomonadaceae bacterium]|nr:hypothetical protein [Selenomonadaceae bacterium]